MEAAWGKPEMEKPGLRGLYPDRARRIIGENDRLGKRQDSRSPN
jgi:hypothetical protein